MGLPAKVATKKRTLRPFGAEGFFILLAIASTPSFMGSRGLRPLALNLLGDIPGHYVVVLYDAMHKALLKKLPKGKTDTDAAEAIIAVGYPKVEPVLPILLEWMQDLNWPVAQTL